MQSAQRTFFTNNNPFSNVPMNFNVTAVFYKLNAKYDPFTGEASVTT